MRSHAGVAQRMFEALAEKGINIQVISTSEIKVSVLIAEAYTELAVRTLHTKYGLDKKVWIRICEYRFVGNLVHDMFIDVYMHNYLL